MDPWIWGVKIVLPLWRYLTYWIHLGPCLIILQWKWTKVINMTLSILVLNGDFQILMLPSPGCSRKHVSKYWMFLQTSLTMMQWEAITLHLWPHMAITLLLLPPMVTFLGHAICLQTPAACCPLRMFTSIYHILHRIQSLQDSLKMWWPTLPLLALCTLHHCTSVTLLLLPPCTLVTLLLLALCTLVVLLLMLPFILVTY